jgi:hypothetical protein
MSRSRRPDVVLAILLSVGAAVAVLHGARQLDPLLLTWEGMDVWLSGDTGRVFENVTSRESDHYRVKVHPLFSLAAYPLVKALRIAARLSPATAVHVLLAGAAAAAIVLFFGLLRVIGCRHPDAVLFTLLAAVSAFAMFWFVVPETYAVGCVSILLALVLAGVSDRRRLPAGWYTVISALTLSFTITNWVAGLLATWSNFRWRRALRISVAAFALVTVLWGVQKAIFPTAVFFLGDREEAEYVLQGESGGPARRLRAFFFHSIVMPAPGEIYRPSFYGDDGRRMSVQASSLGSGGRAGALATVAWTLLLGLGLWGFVRACDRRSLRLVIGGTLLAQLGLHLLYGAETFLYSAHFGPLLVVLAAFSVLTRWRWVALGLVLVVVLIGGANNVEQFGRAAAYVRSHVTERYALRVAKARRPADPWPREEAHVILGRPGSAGEDKAYHEPGGSFSPSVRSFGISVWITDESGALLTTSDTMPRELVHERLSGRGPDPIPGIVTETDAYRALWSSAGPGRWSLRLLPYRRAGARPWLVVRSVGPAGGPVHTLEWDAKRLRVNGRWSLTFAPGPMTVRLVTEDAADWKTAAGGSTRVNSETGWAAAALRLDPEREVVVTVEDSAAPDARSGDRDVTAWADVELQLPDDDFVSAIRAQVAHIMMGTVGNETRPADPTSYPVDVVRDAAYEIVALARVGKIADARRLSPSLAEHDWAGAFGAEADAPGLALWALTEVAALSRSAEFDRWLWPHVRRKADLIVEMLGARAPLRQPPVGPVVLRYARRPDLAVVTEPGGDGLIRGRVQTSRPALYVSAVSHLGLTEAAGLADRMGAAERAEAWRAAARALETAWQAAFASSDDADPRTFTAGVWPGAIARGVREAYRARLQGRPDARRVPDPHARETAIDPTLEVAEAHQWLALGIPDRARTLLARLFEHQASPGLYTWGAPQQGADPFLKWQDVRGWAFPREITPHYGMAAHVLLLQLDMLTSLVESPDGPTLVIGAGAPGRWLQSRLAVHGIVTRRGRVDWTWDGREIRVVQHGLRTPVRLGPAFDGATPIHLQHVEP